METAALLIPQEIEEPEGPETKISITRYLDSWRSYPAAAKYLKDLIV